MRVQVTGCSSGLGKALCEELIRRNKRKGGAYQIFATGRDVASLKELKAKGVETLQLDVCDELNVKECVSEVLAKAGKIDVLIANAGVAAVMPLLEQPIDQMKKVLDTNLLGVMRMVQVMVGQLQHYAFLRLGAEFGGVVTQQAVTPSMMERRSGMIVAIGSCSQYITLPFTGTYGCSKSGVKMMMDTLRMELDPWNIKVLTVAAGFFKSSIITKSEGWVTPSGGSLYSKVKSSIIKRTSDSQKYSVTATAERIAEQIVSAFENKSPPTTITIGGLSRGYKFLGFLKYFSPSLVFNGLIVYFGINTIPREEVHSSVEMCCV